MLYLNVCKTEAFLILFTCPCVSKYIFNPVKLLCSAELSFSWVAFFGRSSVTNSSLETATG